MKLVRITLDLEIDDALWLLVLIKEKSNSISRPWQPYWQQLAQKIERALLLEHEPQGASQEIKP
jgi:hypothetical protein